MDVMTLAKPRITGMVLLTAVGGFWLATRVSGAPRSARAILTMLVGTAFVVAGANALNMYLERDTDALMDRTRDRPLPAGRLSPKVALAFGLLMSAIAVPLLTFGVNAASGLLGAIALVSYVLVYTPLKRRRDGGSFIGAIPGHPSAAARMDGRRGADRVARGGPLLRPFSVADPHFLAIATFRRDDYERAGLKILPVTRGDRVTRWHIVAYLVALVASTALLAPVGGATYLVVAGVLGAGFLGLGAYGLRASAGRVWARGLFAGSIIYLVALLVALMIGA